jgi:hypothetical protein
MILFGSPAAEYGMSRVSFFALLMLVFRGSQSILVPAKVFIV